jgi:signal transduction histidine kinase
MKRIWNSLYWRISALLLLIFIIVGLAYLVIAVNSSQDYFAETTQKLNANVAESLLLEVNPFENGEVNKNALGTIMHSMMAVNPGIEVYLLSPKGDILSYVVLDKKVKLEKVNILPIKAFIESKGSKYILGDDPRTPDRKTIFSATKIEKDGVLEGYVYIVLASEIYDTVSNTLQESFILNLATKSFIITLIAAFVIGLLAIWLLTRNLRKIIQTVRLFKKGDLHARIDINSKGELGQLAETFNSMAETMLSNIDDLKQVDNLRRDLIANVSHDLRTPLSVIHGYIETIIIKDQSLTTEKKLEYMEIVLNNTNKLNGLVSDLFQLSKLEAKQVELNIEAFSLAELLEDLSKRYALIAKEKAIDFKWINHTSASIVKADLSLIERVLQNLIDNAFNYTPMNGEVEVSIIENEKGVEVSVKNSGSFIEKQDIPHLFDRYYKGKQVYKKASTGLGLAIVKNILDLHKSVIHVRSEKQEGTLFQFALPSY